MESFQKAALRFVDLCNIKNMQVNDEAFDDLFIECFPGEYDFIPHFCSLDEDHLAEIYQRGGPDACREANLQNKERFYREGGGDIISTVDDTQMRIFIRWETRTSTPRVRRWYADL